MSNVRSGMPGPVVPVAAIIVGVVLALVGQFVLGGWDTIQNAVIFVAGLMIGAASMALFQSSQQRA